MKDSISVFYKGFELDVTGDFENYEPAHITADPYYSSPAEGGEVVPERIELANTDILELLSEDAFEEICEKAWYEWEDKKTSRGL